MKWHDALIVALGRDAKAFLVRVAWAVLSAAATAAGLGALQPPGIG